MDCQVWLQTLPVSGLAHALLPYLPQAGERSDAGAAATGVAGAILGGILGSVTGQQNRDD
jgi:hypothetical protein